MNLGLLLGVSAPNMPVNSPAPSAGAEGSGFGSVFHRLMNTASVPAKEQTLGQDGRLTKLLDEVLNADTLEELAGILEKLGQSGTSPVTALLLKDSGFRQGISVNETAAEKILSELQGGVPAAQEVPAEEGLKHQALIELTEEAETLLSQLAPEAEGTATSEKADSAGKVDSSAQDGELQLTDLPNLQKFPSLQQLASLISENPDKLIEEATNVLQDAGVTKEQLDQIAATGDIWFVLDVLQQLPPEQVQAAMGELPQKITVELTALLKAVELTAPELDLHAGQADLVKTIQPILAQFANQLEQKNSQPEVKQPVQIPPAIQHIIRFTAEQSAADTKQQEQQAKPGDNVTPQSAVTQTEARPVFQMNTAEKVPESRSEALMREFQAVLNRANFGQTNGMNRLSVKLYPEHLGQIRIELLEVNGVMTARILASTAMARDMLDSQMHQLRQAFNQQNLQVDRIDLSQTIQDPSKNDREQAFNKQNEQQKEQSAEQNETQDEQEQTFQEFMIELEV